VTDDNPTLSPLSRQAEASIHLERAAFHLHESARCSHAPELPTWDNQLEREHRVDARYRATGALRRGIDTCRMVAVERVAASLAVLDGERWPACNRAINPKLEPAQRAAIAAGRRQRYRHQARHVVAEVFTYYEMGNDTPEQRDQVVDRVREQLAADTEAVSRWRNRASMPSAVSQLAHVKNVGPAPVSITLQTGDEARVFYKRPRKEEEK